MAQDGKINILEIRSCRGGGGGPEKTILFSALEADTNLFDVTVVYLKSEHDPEFDLDQRARALGVQSFYTIEEKGKFDIRALKRLLALCREKNIHVFHAHCYKSDLYGLILRRYHKMVLMTTAHGPLATFKFFWASKNWRVRYLYDQIDLRILKYFDRVLMVSDTMRPMIAKYGVDPRKMTWVRNAIDSRFFKRSGRTDEAFRRELAIPDGAIVIGAVGRLNGEKDYPNLLRATKILTERLGSLRVIIVGKGELAEELATLADQMGLKSVVKFVGHLHDVRRVFEQMDVYVLSSTREGLPNTVLEAMAMEVPIVSTDVDGVKEAVTDGREAILVPAQDAASLAAGIEKVLGDAGLRERLVRAARARVESEFSFAARTRRVEAIYRELVAS